MRLRRVQQPTCSKSYGSSVSGQRWFTGLERASGLVVPKGFDLEFGGPEFDGELTAAEKELCSTWTEFRQSQFRLGRSAARRAIGRRSRTATDTIGFDDDGAPSWPIDLVGSLSHKRLHCVAIVGDAHKSSAVGIDLEIDAVDRDEKALVERVCATDRELAQLAWLAGVTRSPGTLFLSAKEAFYKMQFPKSRRFLDWEDVEVIFEPPRFRVIDGATEDHGVFVVADGWILTICDRNT